MRMARIKMVENSLRHRGKEPGPDVERAPVARVNNAWGLHGVGGNVREACVSDNDDGTPAAWRGASWYNHDQRLLKASYRYVSESGQRLDISGFRLVLEPISPFASVWVVSDNRSVP